MKKFILFFTVAGSFALAEEAVSADDAAVPGEGFAPSHYETLWTKSPFSVATPDAVEASPDYTLVGITQLEGVAYASVIDTHSGDHFLISSEKAIKGMKLISITRSHNGTDTFASVQKDGQPLNLKLQSAPATAAAGANPGEQPPIVIPPPGQNIPMPGTGNQPMMPGAYNPNQMPPRSIRVHRPVIHLPPMPPAQDGGANQPPPQPPPPTADGVQPHVVPPAQ